MADSALTPDPLERYGAIERAYCEERWMAVIHDGQTLLSDLAHAVAVPPEGLKERLELLIGHSFLYGLGDRDSAEDHYQAVLRSGAEASLRQIAEQGLQQCALPAGPADIEEEEEQVESAVVPAVSDASAVWQEDAALDSPVEPVTTAPPDRAPTSEHDSTALQPSDGWGLATPQPQTSSEPADALGWLTAGTTAVPPQGAAQPVMPWLEVGTPAAATPTQPESAVDAQDLAASQEWSQPEADSLPPQSLASWSPLAAAPVQEGPAAGGIGAPPATPGGDVEPPLSPEAAASLAAAAAALTAAWQRSESGSSLEPLPVEPDGPSAVSADAQELPEPALVGAEPASDLSVSAPSPVAEESLVADVVEEPELIELHQASERRGEEILLEAADGHGQPLPSSLAELEASTQVQTPVEAVLPPGLQDRRGTDLDSGDFQEAPAEAVIEPAAEPTAAEDAAPVEASPRDQAALGLGPFSAPPEPVAEEDPELLMGLLKVEMG